MCNLRDRTIGPEGTVRTMINRQGDAVMCHSAIYLLSHNRFRRTIEARTSRNVLRGQLHNDSNRRRARRTKTVLGAQPLRWKTEIITFCQEPFIGFSR